MKTTYTKMNNKTYIGEYNILPEHNTFEKYTVLFGGMNYQDDINELGEVKLLGRWNCVGQAKGFFVAEANNVTDLQKWLNNWITMGNIKIKPCIDDNLFRELILGEPSDYKVTYNNISANVFETESLYFLKYKYKPGKIEEGFEKFAQMTEEDELRITGDCTCFGRWHNPSDGSGYIIASCPNVMSLYRWIRNLSDLIDFSIYPVIDDIDARQIIRQSYGFDAKYDNLLFEIMKLEQPSKKCF